MVAPKQTPLYDQHVAAGARIIDFSGWSLPVRYTSVVEEHLFCRNSCAIFDVSHMGEIAVEGNNAGDFLQMVTINDVSRLAPGQGQYSAILNHNGGMIDDLIVYRLSAKSYLLCVNAANTEKDHLWLVEQARAFSGLTVTNVSSNYAQIAVQGPRSSEVLTVLKLIDPQAISKLSYMSLTAVDFNGQQVLLARSGYTGELGYELYVPPKIASQLWHELCEHPQCRPAGLGARDTLRLEACYLLYGQDMNDEVSPLEAGIAWATRLDKGEFLGKEALLAQKNLGVRRKLIAFKMQDKGIPRTGMEITFQERSIGNVTSGSMLPFLGFPGGLALVESNGPSVGDAIEVNVRGTPKQALVVKKPMYQGSVKG